MTAQYLMTETQARDSINGHKWRHYVYGLCRDDGLVFYIGKGVDGRLFDHAKEANTGGNSEKCKYIRAIGDQLRFTIFIHCEDDPYAAGYEAFLLSANTDCLLNIAPASKPALENMFKPVGIFQKAMATIEETQLLINEMQADVDNSMRNLAKKYPHLISEFDEKNVLRVNGGDHVAA